MLSRDLIIKINKKHIMAYIVIFFAVFGPKFFGVVDVSIIVNVLIISLYILLEKAKIRKHSSTLFLMVIMIVMYSLVVCTVTQNLNIVFIAKFVRVGTSIVAISMFIDAIKVSKMDLVNILINILLLHAVIVIISATFFVQLQNILKPFTGFRLIANRFRSTGLTNGFDFSGLLCIFGVLLVGLYPEKYVIKRRLLKLFIFIGASLLTSRVTMIVLELAIIYMALMNKRLNKKVKRLLVLILVVSLLPVMGIFLFSTGNQNNVIVKLLLSVPVLSSISEKLVYYYATTDIGNTISAHFSFVELSSYEVFFGSMKEANQDPGYTQYIYYIGVCGVLLVVLFYALMVYNARKKTIVCGTVKDKYLFKVLIACVGLCLCLSIKNSYLLARHVTEVILIITSILYKNELYD